MFGYLLESPHWYKYKNLTNVQNIYKYTYVLRGNKNKTGPLLHLILQVHLYIKDSLQ